MGFIRENVFLIAVIAVVVVIGGIMLAAGFSWSGDIKAAIEDRDRLSNEIGRLARVGEKVNREVIDQKTRRLTDITRMQGSTEQILINWNRASFVEWARRRHEGATLPDRGGEPLPVLHLATPDGKLLPAFPFDAKVYEQYGLFFFFTTEYGKALSEMLARVEATTPPTDEEIEKRADEEERVLRLGLETKVTGKAGKRTTRQDAGIRARAVEIASEALIVTRAKDGPGVVYASIDSLDRAFERPLPTATTVELWRAQVNLWVQADVIEAIRATNDAVLGRVQGRKRSIVNAAVKRLVKIDVADDYYVRRPDAAGTLTERSTNTRFDAVHYTVKAILAPRHLRLLEQKLLGRNQHTVLKWSMLPPQEGPKDRHYYGAEPVMEITLDCELLLLTPWVRGQWDAKAKEWSAKYPPLVPVKVLDQYRLAPDVLRPEDTQRLKKAGL